MDTITPFVGSTLMFATRRWLRNLLGFDGARKPARRALRKATSVRLAVEPLEHRELLSGNPSTFFLDKTENLYQNTSSGQLLVDTGVISFAVTSDGTLYDLHNGGGLYSLQNGIWSNGPIDTGVTSFAVAPGTLFDLHNGGGLYSLQNGIWSNGPIDTGVTSFAIVGNGDVADLRNNGQLVEETAAGPGTWTTIDNNVYSFAIAGNGDVVDLHTMGTAAGNLYEQTAFRSIAASAWVTIDNGVASFAIGGNGDVVDLHTRDSAAGNLYEQTSYRSNSAWVTIDNGVASFAIAGNGDVVDLHTRDSAAGNLYEQTSYRSNSAWVTIDNGVASFAIAGNGDVVDLHTRDSNAGNLFEQTAYRSRSAWAIIDGAPGGVGNVSSFAIAGNGDVVDLHQDGWLYESTAYRAFNTGAPGTDSPSWKLIDGSVGSFAIAGNGDVVDLHTSGTGQGDLYEQTAFRSYIGWVTIDGTLGAPGTVSKFAIAGNGDVVDLHAGEGLYEQTSFRSYSAWMAIDNGVAKFDIAGDGDVVDLHTSIAAASILYEQTAVRSYSAWAAIDNSVIDFAIAGDGDVVDLHTGATAGILYEQTAFHSDTAWVTIDNGVWSFAVAGNGDVVDWHTSGSAAGNLYEQTAFRSIAASAWVTIDSGVANYTIAGNGDVIDLHQDGWEYESTAFRTFNTGAPGKDSPGWKVIYEPGERVIDYGGSLLPNVEVQGLYYGNSWLYGQSQQLQYLDGFLSQIVNSSYMDMLTNAGYGVGRGTFAAGNIYSAVGNTVYDSAIRAAIQNEITNGSLALPDANRLYVVYVGQNMEVVGDDNGGGNSVQNFAGYHGAFSGTDANGASVTIHYAVVTTPGGTINNGYTAGETYLSTNDEMTQVASHEIAESVTDPNVNYSRLGWYDYADNGEIGDLANGQTVYLNGYAVQRIADKFGNAMTPTGATPATITYSATTGSFTLQGATNAPTAMAPQGAADQLFMALSYGCVPAAMTAFRGAGADSAFGSACLLDEITGGSFAGAVAAKTSEGTSVSWHSEDPRSIALSTSGADDVDTTSFVLGSTSYGSSEPGPGHWSHLAASRGSFPMVDLVRLTSDGRFHPLPSSNSRAL
jgi:ATP-dependent protease HslVU (ClpYQ) peptidase subunit